MNLHEYYRALMAHDWHYQRSDDSHAYRRGRDDRDRLVQIANSHADEAFSDLYTAYADFVFNAGERPEYRGFTLTGGDYVPGQLERTPVLVYKGATLMEGEFTSMHAAMDHIDLFMNEVDRAIDSPLSRIGDLFFRDKPPAASSNVIPFPGGDK